ncbi:acetyltransferase, partial [Pseudomonas syringae]
MDFLPAPLRGVIASLLLALNTIVCCTVLFAVTLLKVCLPFSAAQRFTDWLMSHIHETWIGTNNAWIRLLCHTRWHLSGLEGLDYKHSYLVTSNHQSWVDIMVLQYVLNRRIRPLKFFLKQELIWVPVIGLAWWALGFPFMKRYS